MAVQGVHSFDNDDAVEWARAYCDMGFDVAASTIQIALEDFSNNRLSASIAARGVAAVEAVSFVLGRGGAEAQQMFKTAPMVDPDRATELLEDAEALLSAIAKASELSTQWAEVGAAEHKAWVASLDALRTRLVGATQQMVPAPDTPKTTPGATPTTTAPAPAEVTDAILALSRDIDALRQEMKQGFARLARQIEEARR